MGCQRFSVSFTALSFIILLFSTFLISNASAQDEELFIVIYDPDTTLPIEKNIFLEEKSYDIAIGSKNQTGFVYNATISVPWAEFITSEEMPWINIESPNFEDYNQFVITASKEGFQPAEIEIAVIKGMLIVTTDKGIVEEKESFQITVTDQNENAVEDSIVYLDVEGYEADSDSTNTNGVAYLEAPDVDEKTDIAIIAFKEGYEVGSKTIRVEGAKIAFIDDIAPVLGAVIVLIFSLVFVRFRKKISRPVPDVSTNIPRDKKKMIVDESKLKKVSKSKKTVKEISDLDKGPRVEEIRIPEQDTLKEPKRLSEESQIFAIKKSEYEWFQGTDYMRYKIDKLTKEMDKVKADKWFEGVQDIQSKVDETLKKKQKKKNKSE